VKQRETLDKEQTRVSYLKQGKTNISRNGD